MVALAAFAVAARALRGASTTSRSAAGSPTARDPAAERLIGMTVGTAALRVDLAGDPTVSELLRRVRATVLDAIANADVPFERVVEALAPPRQATRSPLIQTLFSFDDAPARKAPLERASRPASCRRSPTAPRRPTST